MEFNDNAKLDPSQMGGNSGGGGGGRGPIAVGGGIGTMIILFVLSMVFGVDLTGLAGGQPEQPSQSQSGGTLEHCQSGADIKKDQNCRFVAYTNSIQNYWSGELEGYQVTKTNPFTGSVSTQCGNATSDVGPFYCPADMIVYLDTSFFEDQLITQLGAKGGMAAEAYVIAHEYGHHISNLTGQMQQAQSRETGPDSPSVRLELQADCYAGTWLKHAADDPSSPISSITREDVDVAMDAAKAVGDDRIQERAQGRVDRESWTHGSAQMRQQWLHTGFDSGDPAQCNTFARDAKVA